LFSQTGEKIKQTKPVFCRLKQYVVDCKSYIQDEIDQSEFFESKLVFLTNDQSLVDTFYESVHSRQKCLKKVIRHL
jgi:hypothetical protein